MTRKETLTCLMRGVAEDLNDYRALNALLEEQFDAALRYETAKLSVLAERIMALVVTLDSRRMQRVALVTGLLGEGATMPDMFSLINEMSRVALESGWKLLENLVQESKQKNERNCKLLMDQHEIMLRVLHGEDQVYAPA
jgi:flagellar biosynthesis protein FlgN